MQLVYRSTLINDARIIQGILSSNDIPCVLRNDILQSLSGEIPFVSVWPEVWVLNDADADSAKELIETKPKDLPSEDWECRTCGETSEGTFDACWSCGAERETVLT